MSSSRCTGRDALRSGPSGGCAGAPGPRRSSPSADLSGGVPMKSPGAGSGRLRTNRSDQAAAQKRKRLESGGEAISGSRTGPSAVTFRPIKRPRVYEEITSQIRGQIVGGQLRPGDRLPNERDLAATFGVSRPALRQALAALESLGLIESRVGSGTYVSERSWIIGNLAALLTAERGLVTEPLEVRRIVEPHIARLAAERATPAEIAEAASWIDVQAAQVEAGETIVPADTAFHDTLARAGKNQMLVRLVEALHEMLRPSRERSLQTAAGARESLDWHRRILAAVVERDGQRAEAEMLAHLNSVEAFILASLSGQERPRAGDARARKGGGRRGPSA